jgi:hypothetical protein
MKVRMMMRKLIVLDYKDKQLLNDVLEYFINDSREKDDFITNHSDNSFDEYDNLDHEHVLSHGTGSKHIYYKLSLLHKRFLEAQNE